MDLQPLSDRVVVEVIDAEEVSAGGVILPDNAREQSQRGTVLAVGPGGHLDSGDRSSIEVDVGDEVVFSRYGGTEISRAGDDFLLLRESDILAKVV